MSLEWARVRALQNEARLHDFLNTRGPKAWTELALTSPAAMTIWVAHAKPAPLELARAHQQTAANSMNARAEKQTAGVHVWDLDASG
jgi:hypothetical protein